MYRLAIAMMHLYYQTQSTLHETIFLDTIKGPQTFIILIILIKIVQERMTLKAPNSFDIFDRKFVL